jgi:hypothetical protein
MTTFGYLTAGVILSQAYHFYGLFHFKAGLYFIGKTRDIEKTRYLVTDRSHSFGKFGFIEFKDGQTANAIHIV